MRKEEKGKEGKNRSSLGFRKMVNNLENYILTFSAPFKVKGKLYPIKSSVLQIIFEIFGFKLGNILSVVASLNIVSNHFLTSIVLDDWILVYQDNLVTEVSHFEDYPPSQQFELEK